MNNGKYETHVKPAFNLIREMCELGQSNAKIAENLGIAERTLYTYMEKHPELAQLIANARKKPVELVKSALLKRALGYEYNEIVTETGKDGQTTTTVKTKHLPPDPTSCLIILKHWAKDEGWTHDPQTLELKKQELQIKKEAAERENW